jgi:hypothetical protein
MKSKIDNLFVFLFLIIFPFGQIIRLSFPLFGYTIPLQPIDVIVGLAATWAIWRKMEKPMIFRHFLNFLKVAAFSFLVSIFIFGSKELYYGLFYLIRIAAYFYFFIYIWNFVGKKENKKLLVNSLLGISVVAAVLGWVQYFAFPNMKPLVIWGWDDHLFRMAGTFLDPGFLGLILVFGLLISLNRYIINKKIMDAGLCVFLLVSLAFTYSRASYLALFAGILTLGFFFRKFLNKILLIIFIFMILVFTLPISKNRILSFTRSFSALARIENYKETLLIIKKYPVMGVGYNNLCLARAQGTGIFRISSHACSGADASLLFILATTGIVGFVVFVAGVVRAVKKLKPSTQTFLLYSCLSSLFVHSLFSNSLFYPWVMGYLIILLAVTERS